MAGIKEDMPAPWAPLERKFCMQRLTTIIVSLCILIYSCTPWAFSSSLVGDIEHNIKKLERKLCSELPSHKCKRSQLKPASKPAHLATPAHKTVPKGGQTLVPSASAVQNKPSAGVPAEIIAEVKTEPPKIRAVAMRPVPPMPHPRPDNLKPSSGIAADAPKPSANLPHTRVTVRPPAPHQRVPVTVSSKPAAGSSALPPVAIAVPRVTPPKLPEIPATPVPAVIAPVIPAIAIPPKAPAPTVTPGDKGCLAALSASGASFAPVAQPSNSSSCQIQTPVRLFSIASKAGSVKLPDQPTVNCAFALKLSAWVDTQAQILALKEAGSTIIAMGTEPGFDCRGRNGDSSAKMSEHAIGDAVDIVYMKLADKTQILVKDALNMQSPHFAFLRDVRATACLDFTTVLGPGTNAAHAEHFHIDLEQRRGDYRMCE